MRTCAPPVVNANGQTKRSRGRTLGQPRALVKSASARARTHEAEVELDRGLSRSDVTDGELDALDGVRGAGPSRSEARVFPAATRGPTGRWWPVPGRPGTELPRRSTMILSHRLALAVSGLA